MPITSTVVIVDFTEAEEPEIGQDIGNGDWVADETRGMERDLEGV